MNEFSVATPSARRVLVIDDDRDVADSLAMLLNLMGCDVRTAYSGAVGISLMSDFHPRIVFLDLGMPEMNGYETARRIRSEPAGQKAQLVALTGWGQDVDRRRTREAGFDRHLVKPADIDILEEIVAACGDESEQI
ncbi:MAG TPA: response regulator [Methylocystis sp.]|jgi:DNA-binding response OmpR family regulator